MTIDTGIDSPRRRLLELTEARGLNLTALSRSIGRNPGYLRDYIRKHSPTKLDEDERVALAALLGCEPAELKGELSPLPHVTRNLKPGSLQLPVFGRSTSKGVEINLQSPAGITSRPPILQGSADAYAVHVFDATMSPAFEPGHLVWVDPSRPITDGDDVLIVSPDGLAMLRRLVKRTSKGVMILQWNPSKREDLSSCQVAAMHLIVGSIRVRS